MQIIDKKTDYYDYIQHIYGRDTSLTFDRSNSFKLTKYDVACLLNDRDAIQFLLLQICNTFWLFMIEVTEYDGLFNGGIERPSNYKLELLIKWTNYDKPRCLMNLDVVEFSFWYKVFLRKKDLYEKELLLDKANSLAREIDTGNFRSIHVNNRKLKNIPILNDTGIPSCVQPLDIYLALEEYFSLEKTSSERREPIGTTDTDRIERHGFDKKTSFRGKQT